MKKIHKKLVKGIKSYFKRYNLKKAVIGLSGGIDSAVSLKLVADALGNNNVVALIMPEKGLTKKENIRDAKQLCRLLNVKYEVVAINRILRRFRFPWKINKTAEINTKSRVRANILYNFANTHNALVIGTSNKSELVLGYFTKHGDGAADIEVIGDLYKTEVVELAKYLRLPAKIITKIPSAELFHGHTDEQELGASYEEIDKILKNINKAKGKLASEIKKRIKENEHKTKAIPIVKK